MTISCCALNLYMGRGQEIADELLDVTNYLLDDLDTGVRGDINIEGIALPTGVRGVDTKKLAAMTIAFEVVARSG